MNPLSVSTPKVSVLLAVHNGFPFLPQTVQTILRQTFIDFEFVIVDDGSTDDTPRYLRSLRDAHVRHVRNDIKAGVAAARNRGLALVRTDYVAVCDADDLHEPARLERQYNFLINHPDCVVIGCQANEIDATNRLIGERRYPTDDGAIRWQMIFACPFLHPGTMFRRQAAAAIGDYDETCSQGLDYSLWTRIAKCGELTNLNEKLVQYRIHPSSITMSQTASQVARSAAIVESYVKDLAPHVKAAAIKNLFYFLYDGRSPTHVSKAEMAIAYQELRATFLRRYSLPSTQLLETIDLIQWRLRRQCLYRASQDLIRPFVGWSWLKLARRLDRENGGAVRMVTRTLGKMLKAHVQK